MTIFFCVLLVLLLFCGKGKGWGALGLVAIDLALIFAILKTGGWV